MMYLLDARAALHAFVSLLMLPAAIMLVGGLLVWYRGSQKHKENNIRAGKMATLFGAIMLVIFLICLWFLSSRLGLESGGP
jgi:uncharacterized membrane protein YidH (DUF202 family)